MSKIYSEAELMPCPFCGSADVRVHDHGKGGNAPFHRSETVFTIGCYKCGAGFPGMYENYGRDKLTEKWNTRIQQSSQGRGEAVRQCNCPYESFPAKSMESMSHKFDASPDPQVPWCRLCGHALACHSADKQGG